MTRRFRVNSPAVAAEIIDGEAVIMNLKTGAYFSTRQTGSLLWSWIEQGIPDAAMIEALAARCEAAPGVIVSSVDRFLTELLDHHLIRELPLDATIPPPAPQVAAALGPFKEPVLEVYTDMQDLLLLDPIHDVDEEVGWPRPKLADELSS